ncbi:MAG: DUF4388 domain-containing protein [Myxococcota bacterium]
MALKGTIKDFGIADIFQLIGHQAKTGVLILRDEVDEVRVYFQGGAVVRAESSSRPQHLLLGSMLLNAEVLTKEELDRALKEQERTLKKIGTVLTDLDLVTADEIRAFAYLQMTETVFRLFTWENGTYEFEQTDTVPTDDGVDAIRAEGILMEGLRMIDEWPLVRKRLPSYAVIPERIKPLPPPKEHVSADIDLFGFEGENSKPAPKDEVDLGDNERRVYDLIGQGRDVQKLIHISRLGEFETCRSILTLVSHGFVRLLEPKESLAPKKERLFERLGWGGLVLRSATFVVLGLVGLTMLLGVDGRQLGISFGSALVYRAQPAEEHLALTQQVVLRRALEVYRLAHGAYPATLDPLVTEQLVRDRDLRFPFQERYFYKADGRTYTLLRPLR